MNYQVGTGKGQSLSVIHSYKATKYYFLPFPSLCLAFGIYPKFLSSMVFFLSPSSFHSLPVEKWKLPGVWLEYMFV